MESRMILKILILEDNEETMSTYVKALRSQLTLPDNIDCEIHDVVTTKEAIKHLQSERVDILVADLKVRGISGADMGGMELVTCALKQDSRRPVVVITGYGTIQLARTVLKQGVFDFIEKSPTAVKELVAAVQRAVLQRHGQVLRSGNPFRPMAGLDPLVFGGRSQEIEFFEECLSSALKKSMCQHFVVLGNWGIGKSTLLREYKRICTDRDCVAAIVPLQPVSETRPQIEIMRSIADSLLRDIPFPTNRLHRVLNYFDSLGISVLGTGVQVKRSAFSNVTPQGFLHDTLSRLWEDLQDRVKLIAIFLDDVDLLVSVPDVLITIKQTLSMSPLREAKLLVGLACNSLKWEQLISKSHSRPLAKYFLSRVELRNLDEQECIVTLSQSLKDTGVRFDEAVCKNIFEETGGHPFEMQVLCYHLFRNQLSGCVTMDVWEKSLNATLEDLALVQFRQWWTDTSEAESRCLCELAQTRAGLTYPDLKSIVGSELGEQIEVNTCLDSLEAKGLIVKKVQAKTSPVYVIGDRMFRTYLQAQVTSGKAA
jgi:FixJ family two-component response regulator